MFEEIESALAAALDAGPEGATDPGGLLAGLLACRARLDALLARTVAVVHGRRVAEAEGAGSTRAWLCARANVSPGEASRLLAMARAVPVAPAALAAAGRGRLHGEQLRVIADTLARVPEPARADCERLLLEQAEHGDARVLAREVAARIIDLFDPAAALVEPERLREQRALHVSRTFQGMVDITGRLDPASGEAVLAAIEPLAAPLPQETRSAAQRRADALAELARHALADGSPGQVGGAPAQVVLHVDVLRLQDRLRVAGPDGGDLTGTAPPLLLPDLTRVDRLAAVRPHGESSGGPVDWPSLLAACCQAPLARAVLAGRSEPLDIGRASRQWTAAQRRAIGLRDRRCRWAGCTRPARYCQIDHELPWEDGGPTDMANARLLCAYHHQLRHDGWQLTLDPTSQEWIPSPPVDWPERLARRRRRRATRAGVRLAA